MKKIGRLLAAILAVMVFGGCEDEIEENTAPQNVEIDYYSVDPSCQPRRYYITTNRFGGELTIKCTNARNIYFAEIGENSSAEYGVSDSGEVDVNTLVFNDGNWTVLETSTTVWRSLNMDEAIDMAE